MCPAFEVDASDTNNFNYLGPDQATFNISYDAQDRALQWGRSLVTTLNSSGHWGRRWVPGGNHSGTVSLRVGQPVAFGFWIKANQACTIRPWLEYSNIQGNYANSSGATLGDQSLTANTWTYVARSANYPNAATGLWRTYGFLSTEAASTGFEFKLGPNMGVVGSGLPEVFSDGNTPGWKWLGTPGHSTSAGYPYTLESIAGKPLHDRSNVTAGTSLSVNVGQDMTIYSVCSDTSPQTTAGFYEGYGPSGRAFRTMFDYTNNTRLHFGRFTANDTVLNVIISPSDSFTAGTNIVASAFKNNTNEIRAFVNNSPITTTAPDANNTYRNINSVVVGTRDNITNADLVTQRLLIYPSFHNTETMRQVQAWLARKYGTAIPDGY